MMQWKFRHSVRMMTLHDAAYALDELAAGRMPERARLIAGALALDSLRLQGEADRELLDAAAGVEMLATGGTLDLSAEGRARAALLAAAVRRVMTP
jgi:hypothetical protein